MKKEIILIILFVLPTSSLLANLDWNYKQGKITTNCKTSADVGNEAWLSKIKEIKVNTNNQLEVIAEFASFECKESKSINGGKTEYQFSQNQVEKNNTLVLKNWNRGFLRSISYIGSRMQSSRDLTGKVKMIYDLDKKGLSKSQRRKLMTGKEVSLNLSTYFRKTTNGRLSLGYYNLTLKVFANESGTKQVELLNMYRE